MKMAYVFRLALFALVAALVCVPMITAQSTGMNYVILAKTQGSKSTAFAKSLGPALVTNLERIGVVTATSSDPNFATWASTLPGVQAVAADPRIQWLPNERVVRFTGSTGTSLGANAEPFDSNLWNLRAIHADASSARRHASIMGRMWQGSSRRQSTDWECKALLRRPNSCR